MEHRIGIDRKAVVREAWAEVRKGPDRIGATIGKLHEANFEFTEYADEEWREYLRTKDFDDAFLLNGSIDSLVGKLEDLKRRVRKQFEPGPRILDAGEKK